MLHWQPVFGATAGPSRQMRRDAETWAGARARSTRCTVDCTVIANRTAEQKTARCQVPPARDVFVSLGTAPAVRASR